jgi:hypothetical protein
MGSRGGKSSEQLSYEFQLILTFSQPARDRGEGGVGGPSAAKESASGRQQPRKGPGHVTFPNLIHPTYFGPKSMSDRIPFLEQRCQPWVRSPAMDIVSSKFRIAYFSGRSILLGERSDHRPEVALAIRGRYSVDASWCRPSAWSGRRPPTTPLEEAE